MTKDELRKSLQNALEEMKNKAVEMGIQGVAVRGMESYSQSLVKMRRGYSDGSRQRKSRAHEDSGRMWFCGRCI